MANLHLEIETSTAVQGAPAAFFHDRSFNGSTADSTCFREAVAQKTHCTRWLMPATALGAAMWLSTAMSGPAVASTDNTSSTQESVRQPDLDGRYATLDFIPNGFDLISNLASHLVTYRGLEDGWDGAGSVAPPENAIQEALRFIDLLPNKVMAFEAMAAADGEVGLCCVQENFYADIGFRGDGTIAYFVRSGDGAVKGIEKFESSPPRELVHALTAY